MRAAKEQRSLTAVKWILLCVAVLFLTFAGQVLASEEPDWDDPDYVKRMTVHDEVSVQSNGSTTDSSANPYTGLKYTHADAFDGSTVVCGIDVSKWNGSIDWEKVKADGIEFAILRVGYSTLADGTRTKDEKFDTYLKGAQDAGMKIGVYYFSQAITQAEAVKEAEYALSILGNTRLDYPVAFDFEPESQSGCRQAKANLSKSAATNICLAFCDTIRAAGYDTMVYGNVSALNTELNASTLAASTSIWVARYNTVVSNSTSSYSGAYSYWQYSSEGKVSGISGNTDCDFYYRSSSSGTGTQEKEKYASSLGTVDASQVETVTGVTVKSEGSTSSLTISFDEISQSNAAGYQIWRSTARYGTYKKIKTLGKGTHQYVNTGRSAGKEYYYQVRAYIEKDGSPVYGEFSEVAYTYTARTGSYKVKTTKDAALRSMAGSDQSKKTTIPQNTSCAVTCVTRDSNNLVWYKVKYVSGGTTYQGYVSSKEAVVAVKKTGYAKAKKRTATTITLQWKEQAGISGYLIYRSDAKNGKYQKIAKVKAGTDSYKDTGLKKYTRYYYKVRAYSLVNGVKTCGSSAVTILSTKKTSLKLRTVSSLNLRKYAGTNYKLLTAVPSGKTLAASWRTRDADGKLWYYVSVTVNGKKYKGYVSSSYVKKVN